MNNKVIMWTVIIGVIIIALAIFFFGRASKKGGVGSKPLDPKDLPNSGSGIPSGWSPTPLVEKLYNAMEGVNWLMTPNGDLFKELATLATDDMVAAVAIDFYNRYDERLYAWIQDETAVGLAQRAEKWKEVALSRLQNVNQI